MSAEGRCEQGNGHALQNIPSIAHFSLFFPHFSPQASHGHPPHPLPLLRHKTAAALIVLEIALSCAIVCNALFLIGNRLDHMQRPSGFDETHLVFVKANGITKD